MKRIMLIFTIIFVVSCLSQKTVKKDNKCKVLETENEIAFDSLFKNIDTTDLFKNKIKDFEIHRTGVLLCQFLPNMKYGKYTLVKKVDDKFFCYNSNSSHNNEVDLKNPDIQLISNNINSIRKKYYYEECDEYISNDAFYLMFVKKDGEIIAKYFSHGNISLKKTDENVNLNMLKSVLEVMYRNSFR
ncbi:hypothetical protein [Flavobacterium sp. 38-13]|uniref:hypothetical protein n=1 Tax=Flavobacterium sp. 38-13 TaxID=1896168 RepID=UPI00095D4FCE|nr:hypothetical protein [Flavobacterium sp. 38-13]OJX53523.1 MAG: hypothetical protein BGO88_00885 [Flavobacterium sp. 38-13]THD30367.1 MAG: hypothetical protein DI588_16525 [Flavobacterium johnsoniae]